MSNAYYASFTSSKYNGYVSGSTNSMTQFTDPAHPQGNSYWYLILNRVTAPDYRLSWNNGQELIIKNVEIGPSTELMFRYTYNGLHSSNIFYYHNGEVAQSTEFDVTFTLDGSRGSGPVFTVPSLDDTYFCDVYLDVINNKAKVVPIAKSSTNVTLYFRLLDKTVDDAYLYAWQGDGTTYKNATFPGVKMTEETISGIKYYKTEIAASNIFGKSTKFIVSDGKADNVRWQTEDFTTADWSERLSTYYFSVAASRITQSTQSDLSFNLSSNFDGVNWDSVAWQTSDRSDYITAWKATSDDDYLYLYFLIDKRRVVASTYIYTGYDTDGGLTGGDAGGGINGKYNARTLMYPFKEVNGTVVCRNGTGWDDYTECPVETRVNDQANPPVSYGVINSDYAYFEAKVSRTLIGATGTGKVVGINHAMNYYVSGVKNITLK